MKPSGTLGIVLVSVENYKRIFQLDDHRQTHPSSGWLGCVKLVLKFTCSFIAKMGMISPDESTYSAPDPKAEGPDGTESGAFGDDPPGAIALAMPFPKDPILSKRFVDT